MFRRLRSPLFRRGLPIGLASALALLAMAPAGAAVVHYVGEARAADGGALLYRESHWIEPLGGGGQRRLVVYRCPDGRAFARKQVTVGGPARAPDFALLDGRTGYTEGVRGQGPERTVYYRTQRGGREHSAPLKVGKDTVIDAGFDAFVRSHWTALLARHELHIEMLVPSRLKTMRFRVVDRGREQVSGRDLQRFRVRLDAWYGFALPHIDVSYDAHSRRLVDYRGISNIRNAQGNNLQVHIHFPASQHQDPADPAAMKAAANAALDGQCRL